MQDAAARAGERKLIPKSQGRGINLPSQLFILDGRKLHKVDDFRVRERKFQLKVFQPLHKLDRRARATPPSERLDKLLAVLRQEHAAQAAALRSEQVDFALEQTAKSVAAELAALEESRGRRATRAEIRQLLRRRLLEQGRTLPR